MQQVLYVSPWLHCRSPHTVGGDAVTNDSAGLTSAKHDRRTSMEITMTRIHARVRRSDLTYEELIDVILRFHPLHDGRTTTLNRFEMITNI